MAWHASVFFELSPRLFSAATMAGNFILPLNENGDSCNIISAKTVTTRTPTITRPYIKESIESHVFPREFRAQGLISNESKQKWKEEILIRFVDFRFIHWGKCPAIWLLAPQRAGLGYWQRVQGWFGRPFDSHFTHQLNTCEPVPFSSKSSLEINPSVCCREKKLSFGLLIFFGVSLIIIFCLAASLSMITEEVILTEGGN